MNKAIIHLAKFTGSKSEDGIDLPDLDNYSGWLILEASGNKWNKRNDRRYTWYIPESQA